MMLRLSLNLRWNVNWSCLDSESHEPWRGKLNISAESGKRSKRRINTENTSTENGLRHCLANWHRKEQDKCCGFFGF